MNTWPLWWLCTWLGTGHPILAMNYKWKECNGHFESGKLPDLIAPDTFGPKSWNVGSWKVLEYRYRWWNGSSFQLAFQLCLSGFMLLEGFDNWFHSLPLWSNCKTCLCCSPVASWTKNWSLPSHIGLYSPREWTRQAQYSIDWWRNLKSFFSYEKHGFMNGIMHVKE